MYHNMHYALHRRVQGTLADLNHLFMATYYLQRGPVTPSGFFPRIDCTSAANAGGGTRVIGNGLPYSKITSFPYFESNIVGSVNFPMGVGYVLAPFLSYWGTVLGRQLQVGRACVCVCVCVEQCVFVLSHCTTLSTHSVVH